MGIPRHSRTNAITLAAPALLGAGLLGAGLLAGCSVGGSHPAAATARAPVVIRTPVVISAPALLRAAQAALRGGGAVHTDVEASAKGVTTVFSDDDTAAGGRQIATWNKTAHATILLIGGVGYIQANLQAMETIFGVPQQQAEQYQGEWIAVRPGEKLGLATYDDLTTGITLSSVATEVGLSGTLTLVKPTTVAGQPAVGVRALMAPGSGLPASIKVVLYVTDNPAQLPLLEQTQGGSYQYRMSFSKWHETLRLTAPANPTPAGLVTPVTSTT